MRRWRWVTTVAVAVLGLAAGAAVGGRPQVPVDYVMADVRGARVAVASPSGKPGVASRAAEVLRSSGWSQVEVRTAINDPGTVTRVYASTAQTEAAQRAARQLGLSNVTVLPFTGGPLVTPDHNNADVVIVVADDFSG